MCGCDCSRRLGPRPESIALDQGALDRIVTAMEEKFKEKQMVRAKFVCNHVDPVVKTVYMGPVYSGSDENKQFFAATPGGQITLNILNQSALEAFKQGAEY